MSETSSEVGLKEDREVQRERTFIDHFPLELLENERNATWKWAKEQGLTDTDLEKYWQSTERFFNHSPSQRLDAFQELVCEHIDRSNNYEQPSDLPDVGIGSGDIANNSSERIDTTKEESESTTIYADREATNQERTTRKDVPSESEPAERLLEPTMQYQKLVNDYAEQADKGTLDWLIDDLAAGEQLSHELLDTFERQLPSFLAAHKQLPPPKQPSKINEETGEVDVPGILLSLNLAEMPTINHPKIDAIVEEIGRRISLKKAEINILRANCEAACKQVEKDAAGYENLFGSLLAKHAESKLKRVKSGKNAGKISGGKTVIYPYHVISFEKTGGMWISDKKEFEQELLKLPDKLRKELAIKQETKPIYDWTKLKEEIIKRELKLAGIADAAVNETGKWVIKPTKEK